MLSCTAGNAFTLPVGVRPGYRKFFPIALNNTGANDELLLDTNGVGLFVSGAPPGTPSLEGVTFRAGD